MRIVMMNGELGEGFGTERVLANSVRLLRAAGHQVFLFGEKISGEVPKVEGVQAIPGLYGQGILSSPFHVRQLITQMTKTLANWKPDIVHLLELGDYRMMARLCETYPVVLTAHLVSPTCPASGRTILSGGSCQYPSGWSCLSHHKKQQCLSGFNGLRARSVAIADLQLRKRSLSKAKFIFAISEYVKQAFLIDGWPEEKLRVVYNPILSLSAEIEKELPNNLIFCAARLENHKGIDLLIRSLKRIESEPWTLWVAGTGSLETKLREQIGTLGLHSRVVLMGRVAYQRVQNLMKSCKVFVQTNLGPEPFGLSVAEASMLGAPVVVTKMPALTEIIEDGRNGIICPSSESAIAEAIVTLLKNEALCNRMKEEGPRMMKERFSTERHLASTLEGYGAALAVGEEKAKESKTAASSAF